MSARRCPRSCLPGGSLTPVEPLPEVPRPPVITGPLNWRKVIEGAGLEGPILMVATMGEPLELTGDSLRLRIPVAAFATEANRAALADSLSTYFGTAFRVTFEVGKVETVTVAESIRQEREEARRALVEAFKNDPVVKEVIRLTGAEIDESSIRALTPEEEPRK